MHQLSIVIVTKDHFELTRLCLESILWSLPRDSYEIILVDDGSTDNTLQLANHFRFLSTVSGGIYDAWNIGISAARSDYIAVLNNDLFFCIQNWWQRIAAVFDSTAADWLFPLTVETQSLVPAMYEIVSQAMNCADSAFEPTPGDIEACCFFLRRSLFDKIGPFDSRFKIWYGEKDYEIRMLQAGILYGRVRNVVVRHFGSSTIGLAAQGDLRNSPTKLQTDHFTGLARLDHDLFQQKYATVDLSLFGLSRKVPFGPFSFRAG